jgi:hypothetical protein
MIVAPFYTSARGLAVEDVWHNNDECELGLSIPLHERLFGEGVQRKHCPVCQALNKPLSQPIRW